MFVASGRLHRAARAALASALLLLMCVTGWGAHAPPVHAATLVNGSGSSYVALAMSEWTNAANIRGIRVNYNGNLGSPGGVDQYRARQVDFAGTEAEWKSLTGGNSGMDRGFQYVPDVAGAVAVMYNVKDAAGRKVDYLHLDQRTIARIFTGDITHWSDPAITATNGGTALPDEPIKVVFRSGRSGTTALFYDFVREAAPNVYEEWRRRFDLPDYRIVELPVYPNKQFAPNIVPQTTSDGIAAYVKSNNGLWSIGYDEFGYAIKHDVEAAWVENGAGRWVKPYAQNIAEALKDAELRPDLSQELSGVYTSNRPLAYPISAYSYMMLQCAPTDDRETCTGRYDDRGVEATLADFVRMVACDGQVKMARIGYSPLPPNLSQEMVRAISRMTGDYPPEQLNASNCNNPTFRGSLGEGATSPPDPFEQLEGGVEGATNGGTANGSGGSGGDGPASADPSASAGEGAGAGATDAPSQSAGGGSGTSQDAKPVSFTGPRVPGLGVLPALVLLAALLVPPSVMAVPRRQRGRGRFAPASAPPAPSPASAAQPQQDQGLPPSTGGARPDSEPPMPPPR